MRITVVWADTKVQDVVAVELPPGSTVADAVARSGLVVDYQLDPKQLGYSIFGRRAGAQTRLAEDDRVELTRPIVADPRELRQRRARVAHPAQPSPRTKRGRTG